MKSKLYTCATAYYHDPDFKVYTSLEELKKEMKCWRECGIIEINSTQYKIVVAGNLFGEDK